MAAQLLHLVSPVCTSYVHLKSFTVPDCSQPVSKICPSQNVLLQQGFTSSGWCSPQHTCDVCKQGVEAKDKGQLIPCARCPVAYHLHCLPPDILDSPICRVWLNEQGEPDLSCLCGTWVSCNDINGAVAHSDHP